MHIVQRDTVGVVLDLLAESVSSTTHVRVQSRSQSKLSHYRVLGRRLELRWDMLNMFNTTHFGLPDTDVSDGNFGQISSLSGDPRVMQFALKFYF